MICNFPTPYPDEMLYSVCARYSDRMQYIYPDAVSIDLFGHRMVAKPNLPNRLKILVTNLPASQHYTVTNLIDKHTLLPFYEPFLFADRSIIIRKWMEDDTTDTISAFLGLNHWFLPPSCTRFCPQCIQEDRKQLGECYWHRVHQIPCVKVCPYHNIYVQDSISHITHEVNRYKFISAESSINDTEQGLFEIVNNTNDEYSRIANDALWLLQNHPTENLALLQKRYVIKLAELGLASYTGRVYTTKVQNHFQNYYDNKTLRELQCELSKKIYSNWLARLPHNQETSSDPVRHLLFMHFLGHNVETFMKLPIDLKPFGIGPWPCLNPVCEYYQEKCIVSCEIIYKQDTDGYPRGKFFCNTCGFIYSRKGPDHSDTDQFRANSVKVYGPKWDAKLKELWNDSTVSLAKIAKLFNTHISVIQRQAQRLGLLESESLAKSKVPEKDKLRSNIYTVHTPDIAIINQYRMNWMSIVDHNTDLGVGQLKRINSGLYKFLYNHDKDWLKSHCPAVKRQTYLTGKVIDWEERDKQLSSDLINIIERLKKEEKEPEMITLKRILGKTSQRRINLHNRTRLPLTHQILTESIETFETFALRRIVWITECFREENICPTRGQFLERGNLHYLEKKYRSIEVAIEDALQILVIV